MADFTGTLYYQELASLFGVYGTPSAQTLQNWNDLAQAYYSDIGNITQSMDGYAKAQTEDEHHRQMAGAIKAIIDVIDGYTTGSSSDFVPEVTFQQNKGFWNEAIYQLRVAADAYGQGNTEQEHYSQISQALQTILQSLDGYAPDQTLTEFKTAQSEINNNVIQALDGYSTLISGLNTTELQHTQQQNQINQSILQALDGYSTSALSTTGTISDGYVAILTTESGVSKILGDNDLYWDRINNKLQIGGDSGVYIYSSDSGGYIEPVNAFLNLTLNGAVSVAAQLTTTDVTGNGNYTISGNVSVGGNIINKDLSETFQVMRQAMDAYGQGNTEQEHYAQQSVINNTILQSLDGYAQNSTITEHYQQLSQAIDSLRQASDGYASLIGGLDSTELQHTQQQNQVNQTILQAMDGYASVPDTDATGDGYVAFFTGVGRNIAGDNQFFYNRETNQLIMGVGDNEDLTKPTLAFGTSSSTGDTGFMEQGNSDVIRVVINGSADWYIASDRLGTNTSGKPALLNTTATSVVPNIVPSIGDTNTGIGSSGSDQLSLIAGGIESIRATTTSVVVSTDLTIAGAINNKDLSETIQVIRQSLDGYLSNANEQEHYTQQQQFNQTLIQSLDGYVPELTFQNNKTAQSQINQTILQTLDGYAVAGGFSGGDGYVAFFTGVNTLAGDNDLYWDRANNRLGIGTITPNARLTVSAGDNQYTQQLISSDGSDSFIPTSYLNIYRPYSERSLIMRFTSDDIQSSIRGAFIEHIQSAVNPYALAGTLNLGLYLNDDPVASSQPGAGNFAAAGYPGVNAISIKMPVWNTEQFGKAYDPHAIISLDGYVVFNDVGVVTDTYPVTGSSLSEGTMFYTATNSSIEIGELNFVVFRQDLFQLGVNSGKIIYRIPFSTHIDGYVHTDTFNENKEAQGEINDLIISSIDGYNTLLTDIQYALDGYALNSSFEDFKTSQGEINDTILWTLDGYATVGGASGVSELTFQQFKDAQDDINDSILQSLDGYIIAADLGINNGGDGYVAFYNSIDSITGDNDLYYNRETGDLSLNGGGKFQIGDSNFNLNPDGYSENNPAITFDSGDLLGFDRINNNFIFNINGASTQLGSAALSYILTGFDAYQGTEFNRVTDIGEQEFIRYTIPADSINIGGLLEYNFIVAAYETTPSPIDFILKVKYANNIILQHTWIDGFSGTNSYYQDIISGYGYISFSNINKINTHGYSIEGNNSITESLCLDQNVITHKVNIVLDREIDSTIDNDIVITGEWNSYPGNASAILKSFSIKIAG